MSETKHFGSRTTPVAYTMSSYARDEEINRLEVIAGLLDGLSLASAQRVLGYLTDRYSSVEQLAECIR